MKSDRPAGAPATRAERLLRLATGEVGRYLFFGVLTTLVNSLVYWLSESAVGRDLWLISEILSIGLSILFAYIVNRRYVFFSTNPVWPEIAYFFGSRLLVSFVFEVGAFYLVHDVLGFQASLVPNLPYAKLIGMVFVIAGNYVISKFALFKTKEKEHAENGSSGNKRAESGS